MLSSTNIPSILEAAHEAAHAAALSCTPRPMRIQGYPEPILDGVCGFAAIDIYEPKTAPICRHLLSMGRARKRISGKGVSIRVFDYNQSYERKLAYAETFADFLRKYGFKAYATGTLD